MRGKKARPATSTRIPHAALLLLAMFPGTAAVSQQAAAQQAAAQQAPAAEEVSLNPERPTISNSSGIQSAHVVQVEIGYDAYPRRSPSAQHTVDTAVFYTPTSRIRLDLTWSAFASVHSPDQQAKGIGTVQLGTKLLLNKERYFHWQPGIALQYEAELPSATREELQGYGQQAILLVNKHAGPVNLIANGSVVQHDCQTTQGCSYGGQQALSISFHPVPPTTVYGELVAQNVSQANAPPGTYLFAGFLHRFTETFGIDGGLRFGVSDNSARFGTTIGIVFGRRVGSAPKP